MKERHSLKEDKLPPKLFVIFSSNIQSKINAIDNHNNNNECLSNWYEYIEGLKRYISNPAIAFDYTNRFSTFPNGAKFIRDFE